MRLFEDDTVTSWANNFQTLDEFKKIQSNAPNWFVIHCAKVENGLRKICCSLCLISETDLRNDMDSARSLVDSYILSSPNLADLYGKYDRLVIHSVRLDDQYLNKLWTDDDAQTVIGQIVAIELSANPGTMPI